MEMMKHVLRLLPAVTLFGALMSIPAAHAVPAQPCSVFGTTGDDTIDGTNASETICGGPGNDVINARDGDDDVRGGPGNDTLVAGLGSDVARGDPAAGGGSDVIRTDDGTGGNDLAIGGGGSGFDTCIVDAGDFTNGCEQVVTVP
jgi:Ca2+-binding RTX toxin-like protein